MFKTHTAHLWLSFVLIASSLAGCRGFELRRVGEPARFQSEQRSALNSIYPSERAARFLYREALADRYKRDSEEVLIELDARLLERCERQLAFHLAELAFLQGNRNRIKHPDQALRFYFSAMEYAHAYLFDPALEPVASPYDRAFRWACDFYNRALVRIVRAMVGDRPLEGKSLRMPLVSGELELRRGEADLYWEPRDFDEVLIAADYEVIGVPTRSEAYGLGVPIIAVREPGEMQEQSQDNQFLPKVQQSYPGTVLLRFEGSIQDRRTDPVRHGIVEIHNPLQPDTARLGGRAVPLAADLTTPFVHLLEQVPPTRGIARVINPEVPPQTNHLVMLEPYQTNKIPLILVHGLMSSPMTWVVLVNDILGDPELRQRYQIWFFMYPTGNPIAYSASVLRESLDTVQDLYDPERSNPMFQDAVLVGHSMGGLLSKMMLNDSGNRLWNLITKTPFDEFDLPEGERELLRRAFFFERVTFIHRAVFMATPHGGAHLATSWVGRFGAWLISLPMAIGSATLELRKLLADDPGSQDIGATDAAISGVGNLAPDNPVQREVRSWPFPPDLKAHSIIGNHEAADVPGGTDTIVAYDSSHLGQAVLSEKVVKYKHNVQQSPEGILELRRILHLHLEEFDARLLQTATTELEDEE